MKIRKIISNEESLYILLQVKREYIFKDVYADEANNLLKWAAQSK